jgi:hypothetical protein
LKKSELKREIFAVCEDKTNSENQTDAGGADFFLTNPGSGPAQFVHEDSAKIIEEERSQNEQDANQHGDLPPEVEKILKGATSAKDFLKMNNM